MERHPVTIICRVCVAVVALTAITTAANANFLLNPGFETGTTNIPDSWVVFNQAYRTGTNDSGFAITAHSGAYSLQTYGPFGADFDASGAYQSFSASAGQVWRLTGYSLNWQNDALSGPDGYGVAQLLFFDSTGGTGNVIQVSETPHIGVDVPAPLDTWEPFEVDGIAPSGTATVRAQVLHMGHNTDLGSVWWDDLNLYQPTGAIATNTVATTPAVQISWPTSTPTYGINYQIQWTPNLVFTNLPAVNVLTNAGFEANAVSNAADTGAITGWNIGGGGGKATSSAPKPTHSGVGALRLVDTTSAVPVVWQGTPTSILPLPAAPGQIWDLTGYGYVWSSDQPLVGGYGLLKIVWLNSAGATLQPLGSDSNLVGTAVGGTYGGIESAHVTAGSPQNSWISMEARATAPANTAYVEPLCILVGTGGGGAMRFDDIVLTTGATHNGWQSIGPVYPGTGNTNQLYDTIGTNNSKFYRVTTP